MDRIPRTIRSILFLVFAIAICLLIAFVGVRAFTNKITDIQKNSEETSQSVHDNGTALSPLFPKNEAYLPIVSSDNHLERLIIVV